MRRPTGSQEVATRRRLGLLVLLSALAACAAPHPIVEVSLTGLSPEVVSVEVRLVVAAQPAQDYPIQAITNGLARFNVELPADTRGDITLAFKGLGSDKCYRATSLQNLSISEAIHYSIAVEMKPLDPLACGLVIYPSGSGHGLVTSNDEAQQISCGQRCTAYLPAATSVHLTARPEADSIFLGWSGDCQGGQADCAVTIANDRTLHAIPAFASRQICSRSNFCWENPRPQGNNLFAVWMRTPDDAWAVGGRGVILRWTGQRWVSYPSSTLLTLQSVWGSSEDDVWAAGDGGVIVHWNGISWMPVPSGTQETLLAIRGFLPKSGAQNLAGLLFAAGTGGTVLEWDGQRFAPMATPPPIGVIRALWVNGGADVWAVGDSGLMSQWDGTRWHGIATGTAVSLLGVWGSSPSDVWAVGEVGTVLHYQAGIVNRVPLTTSRTLLDISGVRANDVWLTGDGGIISHYDGTAWASIYSDSNASLLGISATDDFNAWAVGAGGAMTRWNGAYFGSLGRTDATLNQAVLSMTVYGDELYAINEIGALLKYSAGYWARISDTTTTLNGAFILDNDTAWAVGNGGLIVLNRHGQITTLSKSSTASLASIWLSNFGEGWAVGNSGTILRGQGNTWQTFPSGTTNALTSVWGSAADDVWAVGVHTTILHWQGTGWIKQPTAGLPDVVLTAVWGRSADEVYAVGEGGTVLRWNAVEQRWLVHTTGILAASPLFGIWGTGPSDLWVSSGGLGLAAHYDGTQWVTQDSGFDGVLLGVYGKGSQDIWLYGLDGVILHKSPF